MKKNSNVKNVSTNQIYKVGNQMGHIINRKTLIDTETGEIIKEQNWLGYDGFSEKGYRYRNKALHIKYYFDALPQNLSESAMLLLFMISELMNEDNVLVYRVIRKSKFSKIIYKPMDKEDISERIRYRYGKNKFDKCWKELTKHCLKQIEYYDIKAWAVNPAVFSKCKYLPYWLYEEFQDYLNPFLSAITIKKFANKLNDMKNNS